MPQIVVIALLQVCLSFDNSSTLIATGSMDQTVRLWDVQTGQEVLCLLVRIGFLSLD